MYKRIAVGGLVVLGLGMLGTAANAAGGPGFYVGAGVGKASLQIDDLDFDTSDTAVKIFGGYMFNEYFGIDAGYFDGGEQTEDFGLFSVTADMSGLSISLLGNLPLGENFALFGKAGVTSTQGDVEGRAPGFFFQTEEASEDNISYGIGAALRFGLPFELRAEYEAIDIDGGDFNYFTVSGLYRF